MARYLALVPLALALAACGGGGGLSLDPVAGAATKTAKSGGEHVVFQGYVTVRGLSFTMAGTGDFDNRKHVGRMSVQFSGLPQIAGNGEEIFDRTVLYMRLPFLQKRLPGGKRWVKIDLQKEARAMGVDYGALMQNANGDPTQILRYLETASDSVDKIGKDTVAGVETTQYKAVVDYEKIGQAHPELDRSIQRIEQATGIKRTPVRVWVDGDGYVRKLNIVMTVRLQPGTSMRMSLTNELSDFGKHVAVTPPPVDQVVDEMNLPSASG